MVSNRSGSLGRRRHGCHWALLILSTAILTGCTASALEINQNSFADVDPNSESTFAADGVDLPSTAAVPTIAPNQSERQLAVASSAQSPSPDSASKGKRVTNNSQIEPSDEAVNARIAQASGDSSQPNTVNEEPRKQGLLAAMFAPKKKIAEPAAETDDEVSEASVTEPREESTSSNRQQKKIVLSSRNKSRTNSSNRSRSVDALRREVRDDMEDLPGVRRSQALFDIKRKSTTTIINSGDRADQIRVASAAGLARLAPNGLKVQHKNVDVKCLKPQLVRVLKTVERRFGRRVVVTSGYRSPKHNRRVRGAKRSLHMYCAAADIQIDGVSKWELAKYLRSMPGRGGVGTYCHTKSVHVDIGPERDWNWRCRRRRK